MNESRTIIQCFRCATYRAMQAPCKRDRKLFPSKPAGLLHQPKDLRNLRADIKPSSFLVFSSFLSKRHLLVVLDGKSSQEYSVNVVVPQGSILGPTLFLLYVNDLPDDVICNIAI